MKKIAVYKVLLGDTEALNIENEFCSDRFDSYVFTDQKSLLSNNDFPGIKFIYLNDSMIGSNRSSRKPKILPHLYFNDYEWSVYLDNSASLKPGFLTVVQKLINHNKKYSIYTFRHPHRNCIYAEAEEVIRQQLDDETRVREQMDVYRSRGYPEENGLIAGTFIVRKHADPNLIKFSEVWYEHILRYSCRDQLSFDFLAWIFNLNKGFLDGELFENDCIKWPMIPVSKRVRSDFNEKYFSWLHPGKPKHLTSKQYCLDLLKKGEQVNYKPFHWELNQIANSYKSDKGDLYFAAHGYAYIYEALLRNLKNRSLKILQLGLLDHETQKEGPYDEAPSLYMWDDFFPNAKIIGFDFADFSLAARPPSIQIFRGDMGSVDDLKQFVVKWGGDFDIIIDAANHVTHHHYQQQQIAFSFLFYFLKKGGLYFIENLNSQPPGLEDNSLSEIKMVLSLLSVGKVLETKYLTSDFLKNVLNRSDLIHLFDSRSVLFGKICPQALAVIRKSK